MFKIKHLLTFCILAVLISALGLIPQIKAAKAASDVVSVTIDAPVSVPGNTEFIVSVDISQVTQLNAANFRVTFDSSLIALDNVTDGTIDATNIKVDGYQEVEPGMCNVVIFLGGLNEATGSGTLANIKFHALSKTGETSIDFSEGVLSSSLADEIEATWTGSSIFVDNGGTTTSPPTTQPSPAGGGGGGGGGGGSVSSNGKTTVSLRGSSSSEGVVWENIRLASMDTKASLDIAYGTKCTNAKGNALTSVSITQIENPEAAQKGVTVIGKVYELGPSGANFDPPITLTIYYDESSLPEGMEKSGLSIAVWDEESGTYKTIDCRVDTETNTITALISHFSRYAIIAVPSAPATVPLSSPVTTTRPASMPAATPAPTSPTIPSPEIKPAVTSSPATAEILTPAPATTTQVAALPVEKSGKNWWLYGGIIIGAVIIIGLLLFVYITRRRD
jgi:hypothetical protein